MSRTAKPKPLVKKIAEAFRSVGKLPRKGRNSSGDKPYPYTRASDVLEAVRDKLFAQDVLICISEGVPEYVDKGESNGGPRITECRLAVTYTFRDAAEKLDPMTVNGVGRDLEDKALYKAQTGAQKALIKRFGLMAEEVDDPEFEGESPFPNETLDDVAPMRVPGSQKTTTEIQIKAFNEACGNANKTADEISKYLNGTHGVAAIEKLKRGKPFTAAIVWASNGAGTLAAPKPQAVPQQGSLSLRTAPQPIELRIGNKSTFITSDKATYSI